MPGIGDIGGLLGFCSLGQSGILGGINNLCQPGVPQPESATSGVNALIRPPAAPGKQVATPYNQYGMAGQSWAATDLQCSDMTSLIGNDVAGMLFDFAKALDRVTITVYQSAAGEGILGWLQGVADHLISGLGNAIYFPYVAIVVILAAIWLAWQGLIRKRGTRTIEGTIWMVVACAAAIWLIGRPADFTGLGKGVSDGISTTLNTAFANLPSPGQSSCLPVRGHDPQISRSSYSYTSSRTVVDQNANELWTVLVCKPWLDGEFGTTAFAAGGRPTPVSAFARQLLWAQAMAVNERPTTTLINAKQAAYEGIAQTIKTKDPAVYPLFQGKQWTTRLEIAFAALLAALVAGIACTADFRHPDPAQARVLAAAHRRPVLPADRYASRIRPGGGSPLVRDAGRRPAETGGCGARAERAALLLRADHGDLRRGSAVGAEDPDDHAGHRRRDHLPQAVPASVRRGGLRRDRRDRAG